ncbi:hypothetical protein I3760_05G061600 [Carya illinoinensis]|nr:hypothetical protein I3760_05G061600 [Carya illinoinensis]
MGLWKSIRMGWGEFVKHVKFKVRDGSRIYFWHNIWCGESALKNVFPSLFQIARQQDATVADSIYFLNNSIQWNVDFVRNVNDWEVNVFSYYFSRIYELKILQGREDRLMWIHEGNSRFSVHSYYNALICQVYVITPGKAFGKLRCRVRCLSSVGWCLMIKF